MSIYNGNCLELLRMLPDNSVDSIVTDPPYGLSFMGKKWDYDVPSVEIWEECLRVLKPGGHMLAFAGTRTQHRMAVRIEDAGFEIRDMIAWVYGSGFPKSLDVSKALDKAAPRAGMFDAFAEHFSSKLKLSGKTQKEVSTLFPSRTGGLTGCVWNWANAANVPTLEQWKVLQPLLDLSIEWLPLIERMEAEREVIGKQKGTLLAVAPGQDNDRSDTTMDITAPATPAAQQWQGWGTALKPALEPITVARKPLTGTVADNVLQYGTGAINIDGCRVGDEVLAAHSSGTNSLMGGLSGVTDGALPVTPERVGRWPANLMHDGSDEVTGLLNDAARFFYCPKASKADRNYGCENLPDTSAADMTNREPDSDGMNSPRAGAGRTSGAKNNHPTVKPIALMRYLCRLVTPPGGVVLDPFTGSGSTGVAATLEGFNFIGAEMDANFHTIASARLQQARTDSGAPTVITLIEYTSDSKPTGRLCRVPDITREQLADLLPLYGFTGKLDTNTGIMNGYNAERWCFVYRCGMAWHPGTDTTLDALIV